MTTKTILPGQEVFLIGHDDTTITKHTIVALCLTGIRVEGRENLTNFADVCDSNEEAIRQVIGRARSRVENARHTLFDAELNLQRLLAKHSPK